MSFWYENWPKPFMAAFPSERSCSPDIKTDQVFENPTRNKIIIAVLGSQVPQNCENSQNWFIFNNAPWTGSQDNKLELCKCVYYGTPCILSDLIMS